MIAIRTTELLQRLRSGIFDPADTTLLEQTDADDAVRDRLFPHAYLDPTEEHAEEEWQRLVNEGRMLGLTEDELRGLFDEALKNSSPASKANGIIKP